VFHMVLSGRVVASDVRMVSARRPDLNERDLQQRRDSFRAYFPWVELLLISLVAIGISVAFGRKYVISRHPAPLRKYVSLAAIIGCSVFLGAFAIRLLLRFGPSLHNHIQRRQPLDLSDRPSTKETFFLALQGRSQVAVSFDGILTTFRNVGQLPPRLNIQFLG